MNSPLTPNDVSNPAKAKGFSKRLIVVPLAAAVIVFGGFIGYRYVTQAKQISSIAVMPFFNESGDANVDYLSDGMTETLISGLSKMPTLNVKPRSMVSRYKGKEIDPTSIGTDLGVDAIINGRMVSRGDNLSLFVELIDVASTKVIWSQRYDRKQSDIAALQSEVARDVSGKINSGLTTADASKVARNPSDNARPTDYAFSQTRLPPGAR